MKIPMRRRGGLIAGYVVVDDVDADLARLRWYCDKNGGYARRTESIGIVSGVRKFKRMSVHRVVLERRLGRKLADKCVPDHVDGDILNCRRSNLREATTQQNGENRKGPDVKSTTGYRNVCWNSSARLFYVSMKKNGKFYTKGMFHTADEAAWVAQKMRKEVGMIDDSTPRVKRPAVITPRVEGRSVNRNNTSGYRGVTFHKGAGKWLAQFAYGGKKNAKCAYCGLHDTPEKAAKAAAKKRAELGLAV